jgi:hydrogenase nickel incorporation protein HypA/HybF
MHELSLMQSIVDRVVEIAGEQRVGRVLKLRLGVGEMSGVVPDALRFCYSELIAATPLERAELIINPIPAQWQCRDCGFEDEGRAPTDETDRASNLLSPVCRGCGTRRMTMIGGSDLLILDLEVE